MRLLLVTLVLALSLGCVHGTPVANVASPATQVEQTGLLILQAAQAANNTSPPQVTTAQLDAVALACDKLGRLGTTLAQTLSNYNAAKAAGTDTTALSSAVQSLVTDASAALDDISVAVPMGTVSTIDNLVATGFTLYATIAASAL